jgi:hypothetical protein
MLQRHVRVQGLADTSQEQLNLVLFLDHHVMAGQHHEVRGVVVNRAHTAQDSQLTDRAL